jgi:hypothetical protein
MLQLDSICLHKLKSPGICRVRGRQEISRTSSCCGQLTVEQHRKMAPPEGADAPAVLAPDSKISKSIPEPSVAAPSNRKPPPETKENLWIRRWVILSFWAVVACLGLPMWWKTTAIYRADLPLQDMSDWADGKVMALLVALERV